MRRPPRPVQIPKVHVPIHERRTALRMVLVAAVIAASILSNTLRQAQADSLEVASMAMPVQLQGWNALGHEVVTEIVSSTSCPTRVKLEFDSPPDMKGLTELFQLFS